MGKKTVGTVFNTLFCIFKISSAPVSESIQRTIAEQTVKIFRVTGFMAGKILAFFMTEKRIFFSFPIRFFFSSLINLPLSYGVSTPVQTENFPAYKKQIHQRFLPANSDFHRNVQSLWQTSRQPGRRFLIPRIPHGCSIAPK